MGFFRFLEKKNKILFLFKKNPEKPKKTGGLFIFGKTRVFLNPGSNSLHGRRSKDIQPTPSA